MEVGERVANSLADCQSIWSTLWSWEEADLRLKWGRSENVVSGLSLDRQWTRAAEPVHRSTIYFSVIFSRRFWCVFVSTVLPIWSVIHTSVSGSRSRHHVVLSCVSRDSVRGNSWKASLLQPHDDLYALQRNRSRCQGTCPLLSFLQRNGTSSVRFPLKSAERVFLPVSVLGV